ncbi:MAG: carbonic anhydrase family protein [Ekhidna sp.]
MQSPVNIIPEDGLSSNHKVIVHYKSSKEKVANLGHTVEVQYDSGSFISYDGKDYQFKQFHFHTPSEHLVRGFEYAMEMHVVHTYKAPQDEESEYLVVAVFFEEGRSNNFLNSFFSTIPDEEGAVFESKNLTIDATEIMPENLSDFYNYRGSLTTPPFSESVNWIVLKNSRKASAEQISKIKNIEGENARRVQFLYDRKIESIN